MYKFPFQKTIPLTLEEAKKAERNTICSACCTSMGDVPFVDAAIIILYANMLGANDMFSMDTYIMIFKFLSGEKTSIITPLRSTT